MCKQRSDAKHNRRKLRKHIQLNRALQWKGSEPAGGALKLACWPLYEEAAGASWALHRFDTQRLEATKHKAAFFLYFKRFVPTFMTYFVTFNPFICTDHKRDSKEVGLKWSGLYQKLFKEEFEKATFLE